MNKTFLLIYKYLNNINNSHVLDVYHKDEFLDNYDFKINYEKLSFRDN